MLLILISSEIFLIFLIFLVRSFGRPASTVYLLSDLSYIYKSLSPSPLKSRIMGQCLGLIKGGGEKPTHNLNGNMMRTRRSGVGPDVMDVYTVLKILGQGSMGKY